MSTIVGTLDWERPASAVVADINDSAAAAPAFSYLKGAKIAMLAAEVAGDLPAAPGTMVSADGHGFVVAAGEGSVRVTRFLISFYAYSSEDLDAVLTTFGIELPQRLGRVPYLDNRDSTYWERAVRKWGHGSTAWRGESYQAGTEHPGTYLIEPNLRFFGQLLADLQVPPAGWCLDVGCADGWAMAVLARHGRRVAGFDVAEGGLAIAGRHIKDAVLDEFDYYEAGRQYQERGMAFDFILCRNLGIAQKLLDWHDPAWVQATGDLAGSLAPGGVMFWSQLSDRTEQVTEVGFTNQRIDTVVESLRAAGLEPLALSVFGALFSLLLVRPGFPAERREAYHAAQRGRWRAALDRYAAGVPDVKGQALAGQETICDGFRAACALLSTIFLEPGAESGTRLLIAGDGSLGRMFGRVALLLKLPVLAHWGDRERRVDEAPVKRAGKVPAGGPEPTAVVVAEPRYSAAAASFAARRPGIRVLDPWTVPPDPGGHVYLISGDQDKVTVDGVKSFLVGVADWDPPPAPPRAVAADAPAPAAPAPAAADAEVDAPAPGPGPAASEWQATGDGKVIEAGLEGRVTVALAGEEVQLRRRARVPFEVRFEARLRSADPHECRLVVGEGRGVAALVISRTAVWLAPAAEVSQAVPAGGPIARLARWRARPAAGVPVETGRWCSYRVRVERGRVTAAVDGRRLGQVAVQLEGVVPVAVGLWSRGPADSEVAWRGLEVMEA